MRSLLHRTALLWTAFGLIVAAIGLLALDACGLALPGGLRLFDACAVRAAEPPRGLDELRAELDREAALHEKLDRLRRQLASVPACPKPVPLPAALPPTPPPDVRAERKPEPERPPAKPTLCEPGAAPEDVTLDIYLLQDLSGSYRDDLPNIGRLMDDLMKRIADGTMPKRTSIGVGSFVDKPTAPFGYEQPPPGMPHIPGFTMPGGPGTVPEPWTFKNHQSVTADTAAVRSALRGLKLAGAGDTPEAQLEGLLEAAGSASRLGFRKDALRFIVLNTDAEFHDAGDWRGAPRPEDGKPDGDPMNEDYPSVAQVRAALEGADLVPVFLVTRDVVGTYQRLTRQLGRGSVVPLRSDSQDLVDAMLAGIRRTCDAPVAEGKEKP